MTEKEQKKAAKEFAERWNGRGYEKGESQSFWIDLLVNVFGVKSDEINSYIDFENQVLLAHKSFIDAYIPSTSVMIEQKSIGKDLRKGIKQSDGSVLSPFQQAKRYVTELPRSMHPRWIITCNFEEFLVYDMEKPNGEPEQIFLKDLAKEYYRLQFLVETGSEMLKKEMEVSLKAGELVGKLYNAFLKRYLEREPESPKMLRNLNILCVRIVFCLYAEHAGVFGKHEMFGKYLKNKSVDEMHSKLRELFDVLSTPEDERDLQLEDDLLAFPYVNGGLFENASKNSIPKFTDEIANLLINNASEGFDWSEISPTIFGAVFESTLNPETRRSGGMHYTSIENIHKVIDPLFLDDLKQEFEVIKEVKLKKDGISKEKLLENFHNKLASLNFLDPACGSGNFLTETYISLRRLENEVIRQEIKEQSNYSSQMMFNDFGAHNPIQVSIGQFYGIEINDFAVTVAKTALWIAESQMLHETEQIVQTDLDFLPLKSYANIYEGNALRTDWETVVSKDKVSYIMGNPPFVGYSLQTKEQKDDVLSIYVDEKGKPFKTAGKIDYVSAWYFKASQFMAGTSIRTAFVSTNSITQGEQVAGVWKPLYDRFGIHIDFAYRTFRWDSEASLKAHVHCVIVGFSIAENKSDRRLFDNGVENLCNNISPYLINTETIFIDNRSKPICNVVNMISGNRPADGGYLILSPEEKAELIAKEPLSEKYIKQFMMGYEFINNVSRYCLWLVNVGPSELKKMPNVLKRVELCKQDRLNGAPDRQKLAETPTVFREQLNPDRFIALPVVSSQQRKYIPMGYLSGDIIAGNKLFIIPDANVYDFGVLTSNVHMAWMRAVGGRLKSDYSYSKNVVYNNFPWCNPTDEQKNAIEKTAQEILDARALYPDCSLADLYDELTMPPELRKAHQRNDKAVMAAYGFKFDPEDESKIVAELMKMYKNLTEK